MNKKIHTIALATFAGLVLGAGVGGAMNQDNNTPDPSVSIEVISDDTPTIPAPAAPVTVPEASTTTEPPMEPIFTGPVAEETDAMAPPPRAEVPETIIPEPSVPEVQPEPALPTQPTLPPCPEVTYDGINPPVWSTPDGLPPTYDCNGPGYRPLPTDS
jgi:hypothetical protein